MGFFWGDLHGKLHVVKAVVVRVGEEDGQGEGFCLVHQDTHAAPETVWGVVEGAAFRGSRWDDGAGGHGVVATEAVGPGGAQGHIPRAVGELDLHAPKGHPSSSCNGICRESGSAGNKLSKRVCLDLLLLVSLSGCPLSLIRQSPTQSLKSGDTQIQKVEMSHRRSSL